MEPIIIFLFMFSGIVNVLLAYMIYQDSGKRNNGKLNYNHLRTHLYQLLNQWNKDGAGCAHCGGKHGDHFLDCPHVQLNRVITRVEQREAV